MDKLLKQILTQLGKTNLDRDKINTLWDTVKIEDKSDYIDIIHTLYYSVDFPLFSPDKVYYDESELDDTFACFYDGKHNLVLNTAVRLDHDTIIYADGEMDEY